MLDSRTVSKWAAATGLVAGPLLYALAFALQPAWSEESAAYLAEVAAAPIRHGLWSALFALGSLALLAGMLGTARLHRGPRGVVAQAGALIVGLASVVVGGIVVAISVAEIAMVDAAADRTEMIALYDRTEEVGFAMAVFGVVWGGGFMLGTVILAAGLLLRRAVPFWSPLLLVGWLVALSVLQNRIGSILASLVLLGAFAPIAHRIATMPADHWARWQPLPAKAPETRAVAAAARTDAAA